MSADDEAKGLISKIQAAPFRRWTGNVVPKAQPQPQPKPIPKPSPSPLVRPWSEVVIPEDANALERLTYVPGVVGDIVEWIVLGAVRPNRMMALGSALTVVGTLIGHRIQGPTKSATHLYVINLAPTGSGKDWPMQAGVKLIDAMGRGDLIGPGQWASAPGFIKRLKRNPLMICFMDELGDELAKVNAKGGGPWLTAIIGTLKQCYNGFGQVTSAEKVGEESERIDWPAPSILGVATPERFFSSLQPGDLESGFANRLLIFPFEHYRKPPEQIPEDDADEPPAELLASLARLPKRIQPSADDILKKVGDGPVKPPLLRIGFGEGAAEVYRAFSREMDLLANELSQRAAENAVRIATIIAVGRGSATVDADDIEHAIILARQSLEAACGGIEKYMATYVEFPKFCDMVLEWLAAQPGGFAPEYVIARKFGRRQRHVFELDNVIKQLEKEKRIVSCSQAAGSRGPSARGYRVVKDEE